MTGNGSSHRLQEAYIRVNGEQELLAVNTVADLLASKGIADHRGIAVARNGSVVRRAGWSETHLQAGDTIEIVHARQGG